ncbi:MAG: prepilin-type N-terminal cleavage/methylation domain-containing protein [Planctomycetes bacterium]|nr:prepilin-type N-terminal cleavage/methylation domain-containing protein [Planctomycetota bacterium]
MNRGPWIVSRESNFAFGEAPAFRATIHEPRSTKRGFTLIELMVAIGILLVLGVMLIGFLRGALSMTRTGTARGAQFETAQTTLRMIEEDLSQVVALPAHPDGPADDPAFIVGEDPFGRQFLAFTRAWGEEQSTLAGYDSGRGATSQGYSDDFTGSNPRAAMRASTGNIEVVYLFEPLLHSTRLYRAVRSPPDVANGLITKVGMWAGDHAGATGDDPGPMFSAVSTGGAYDLTGASGAPVSLWSQFELVADDVVAFGVECWDDELTSTWHGRAGGPATRWSIGDQVAAGRLPLPRAVRVTLIVAASEPLRAETIVTGAIGANDTSIYVDESDGFPDVGSPSAYLRVGAELVAYGARSGRTFGSGIRGALGTRAQAHTNGELVLAGEAFQKVVQLPVTR